MYAQSLLEIEDLSFALVNLFICDVIERNFAAFVANLPALWSLGRELHKTYLTYGRSLLSHNGTSRAANSSSKKSWHKDLERFSRDPNWVELKASGGDERFLNNNSSGPAAGSKVDVKAIGRGESQGLSAATEYDDNVPLRSTVQHPARVSVDRPSKIYVDTDIHVVRSLRNGDEYH